jgi:uncharacterized Zn-finger protein
MIRIFVKKWENLKRLYIQIIDYLNCEYKSLNKHSLIQHKEGVHSNRRLYKCTISGCISTFKTSGNLYNHLYSHKSGPQLKCHSPDCDYSITNIVHLRRYKNYRHRSDGKMFSCDWPGCQYVAKRPDILERHLCVRTGERNNGCNWPKCGKRFKMRKELRNHLRIHLNDKKHKCFWPQCEYSCVQKSNLKKYIKIHLK